MTLNDLKLNDFRTVHRSTADYELTITWSGNDSNGSYITWVTEGFTSQLGETQQDLIDSWIKYFTPEANTWNWKLVELN